MGVQNVGVHLKPSTEKVHPLATKAALRSTLHDGTLFLFIKRSSTLLYLVYQQIGGLKGLFNKIDLSIVKVPAISIPKE